MTVKYVGEQSNANFTNGKEYSVEDTDSGLVVVDDRIKNHVIATKDNPSKSYRADEFFRRNFVFV